MNPDVLSVANFPPFITERLARNYTVHNLQSLNPAELSDEARARIRGVVCYGSGTVPAALIRALPALEMIAVVGVGYNGVDGATAKERGIVVTNTPDVLTEDVADIGLSLVLATARQLPQAHNFVVAGEWLKGDMRFGTKIGGKTAGIVGLGRIGKAIAKRLSACGMDIAYHGRNAQEGVTYQYVDSLVGLARASDFLIVSCLGSPENRNLINAEVLDALGSKGTLINISRGFIVDETALIKALQAGTIKGAGLDVFLDEPRVPAELMSMPNVVLFPHIGSATTETRRAMGDLALDNLDAYFAGKPVLTRVI